MAKAPDRLSPDREREFFLEGIALFNERRYFEAHEAWEALWIRAQGKDRHFFQGMIQCAIALEHMQRGNAEGARRLFRRSQQHLATLPRVYLGIDIWTLIQATARTLAPQIDPPGTTPTHERSYPQIRLPQASR